MRRLQLFEFLDQAWLPKALRAAGTAYLHAAHKTTPFPALWAGEIARVLERRGGDWIVDIGSGAGGPVPAVMAELGRKGHRPRVTLTDLHPAPSLSGLEYWPGPVNAVRVPRELSGTRTLFLTFHHFRPEAARAVLADAFEQRVPICIFEITSRTATAISLSFLIPLLVFWVTATMRPLSLFQIVFTYVIPAIPLLAFWDGLVSQLRTYSEEEFRELTKGLTASDYGWECGSVDAPRVPFRPCYLIGCPR